MGIEHYRDDQVDRLVGMAGIQRGELQPMLDWIHAPPSLHRIIPVVQNLERLLGNCKAIGYPETKPFQADVVRWLPLLRKILAVLEQASPESYPETWNPSGLSRPDNLIGFHPEYAMISGTGAGIGPELMELVDQLILLALDCANGYRWLGEAGEIEKLNHAVEYATRSVRKLERADRRPPLLPPLPNQSKSLAEYMKVFDAWLDAADSQDVEKWGRPYLSLLTSFLEKKEGISRSYRMGVRHVGKQEARAADLDDLGGLAPEKTIIFRNIPDKKARDELRRQGLHPEEHASSAAVQFFEQPHGAGSLDDVKSHRKRQKGRLQGMVMDNQVLPFHWSRPTPYEVHVLLETLSNTSPVGNSSQCSYNLIDWDAHGKGLPFGGSELRALICLMLWTGRPLENVLTLRFYRKMDRYIATHPKELAWIGDAQTLAIPAPSPTWKTKLPIAVQKLLAHEQFSGVAVDTAGCFLVKLPAMVNPVIYDFYMRWRRRASERETMAFRDNKADHRGSIKSLLQGVNRQHHTRWTEARIGSVMAGTLRLVTGDLADIHYITGTSPTHSAVAVHYDSRDPAELAEIFHKAVAHIAEFSGIPGAAVQPHDVNQQTPVNLGSRLNLTSQHVSALSDELKRRLRASLRTRDLLESHNRMVTYVTAMLGFATGYRNVTSPLNEKCQINRALGLLIISDKDDDREYHARLVPVVERILEQLKAYDEHLVTLASKLYQHPNLQHIVMDIVQSEVSRYSYLFYITPEFRFTPVSPGRLRTYMPEGWSLPLNTNRHFLRTQLRRRGCPAEYVDYFMGHWERGEEPYNPYSMVSPREISNALLPHLDALMKECGWTIMQGLSGG